MTEPKLQKVTCACGHIGSSRYPENYRCTGCYTLARAKGNTQLANKLRLRALKIEAEAAVFLKRSIAFRKDHPDSVLQYDKIDPLTKRGLWEDDDRELAEAGKGFT